MKTGKFLDPKLLERLLKAPETAVDRLDLVYVNDAQLSILRKQDKRGYHYFQNGKPLTEKEQLERIKKLVLPPAWQKVRITHLSNGHLQAVGKDAKQRKQYRYHPLWTKVRNQTKFYRMADFGRILPKLRLQVDNDLRQKGWPKTKVMALIVKLMDETHIRIGNEQYARRNQTYGLTTLRKKHVAVHNDRLKFQFTGKRGKEHLVTVRNKRLVQLVSKCEEIPGWELFKYFDADGEKHSVDSEMVNEYLHTVGGDRYTAKDFRTWSASVIFFDTLIDFGTVDNQKRVHNNLLSAYDSAARALGNTRNVCRKYYVHPHLVSAYKDGSIKKAFQNARKHPKVKNLSASEKAMLGLIEKYRPMV